MNIRHTLCALTVLLVCAGCSESSENQEATNTSAAVADGNRVTPKTPQDTGAVPITYECPDDELTVIDICLGLTADQVLAALRDHDEMLPIQQGRGSYDYSDGVKKIRTDPFVSKIMAESATSDTYFEFHFTSPPGDGKLTHMQRTLGAEGNNLPPLDALTEGLIARYGNPAYRFDGNPGSEIVRTLRWDFPSGKTFCFDNPPDESQGLIPTATGRAGPSGAMQIADRLKARGFNDLSQCAKWLQVQLRTFSEDGPVRAMDMQLSDFATTLTSAEATFEWLDELEAGARKARLENAELPDL